MTIYNLNEFCAIVNNGSIILGLDYGAKKLGFAISNPEMTMSLPIDVIEASSVDGKIKAIERMVGRFGASAIVMGLPLYLDGSYSAESHIVMGFARILSENLNMPIYLQDERLTSRVADSLLKEAGYKRKVRNRIDDSVAASIILNTFIDKINTIYSHDENSS